MKFYLSLLLLLSCTGTMVAQNFVVNEGEIIWQKIYESPLSEEEINRIIQQDAQLSSLESSYAGRTEPVVVKCSGGPIYMQDLLTYFVVIDHKEGGYRITISDLQLVPTTTLSLYGVETTTAPVTLEDYQIRTRDGELRKNNMAKKALECIDQYLTEKFTFDKMLNSGDW